MNRQDWLDYFEALNGRSPEVDEIEAAAQAGEFINDGTEIAYNSNQNTQNPNYYQSVTENN